MIFSFLFLKKMTRNSYEARAGMKNDDIGRLHKAANSFIAFLFSPGNKANNSCQSYDNAYSYILVHLQVWGPGRGSQYTISL